MKVKINGSWTEIPDSIHSVAELAKHLNIDGKPIVIEKNAQILEREDHQDEAVAHEDHFEIVTFVGGG
ncbi:MULTISPECIES: sulfur carrier protein ThiS [Bacillaceae]|uniref:Sulfur carrier protein ThiS n=1 Tax=Metabacillus sediminis TaxID=3117746 RepID=A0ABZ2NG38_9BACI|nr:sulfur carrier protein ThiS [Bacillus sp. SJS]KZZ83329.1 thiamine biosynthesis protein ThiS [Bacillus sp. SJS]